MTARHFLTLLDLSAAETDRIVRRAVELKQGLRAGRSEQPLKHRTLALVFEKSSTRTRVSFEAAMVQFGGAALFLSPRDTQLGRGEPIEDTARVLSRMVDAVAIRTFEHDKLERFARHSSVPVINALTDRFHPCQLLADVQTYVELRGSIRGRTVAWVGDGNNMCHSYIQAARQLEFYLRVASPEGYEPDPELVAAAAGWVEVMRDARQAVAGADLVVTDVWASMGQESERAQRLERFAAYQVNARLLGLAARDALFMHCLPAHRGEEVTDEVLMGAHSAVWDEAENRLHAQKALLEFLLCP
jgi:ornithine carbamoyltransferase